MMMKSTCVWMTLVIVALGTELDDTIAPPADSEEVNEVEDCIDIHQCEHMAWLMDHRDVMVDPSRKLRKILEQMSCGHEQVICLRAEAEFFTETDQKSKLDESRTKCQGYLDTLLISSTDVALGLSFQGFKVVSDVAKLLHFESSNDATLVRVQAKGKCCWEVFENPGFQGRSGVLKPSQVQSLKTFSMASFKANDCA